MKAFFIIPVLFIATSSENGCRDSYYEISCVEYDLKIDESIEANSSTRVLTFYRSKGSIGMKTFSSMPEVARLKVFRSNITKIEDGSICWLPKLEHLELNSDQQFPPLTASLLNNCHNLKSLNIERVQVEPTAFGSMANLELLQISDMNFTHLTKEYLEPLKNLKDFRLYHSEVANIDPSVLCISSKMEKIIMLYNKLPVLTKTLFEHCDNVRDFELAYAYNQYGDLEDDAFHNLINLKKLDARDLNVKHLTKTYLMGLTQLESVLLYESNIDTIDSDAFSDLINLRSLGLSGNKLKEINSAVFENLKNLRSLNLAGNQLNSIDNLRHPELEGLYVDSNEIAAVDADALRENFPKLEILSMKRNGMDCAYRNQLIENLKNKTIRVVGIIDSGFESEECPNTAV